MAEPVSSLLVKIGADVSGLERGARQGSRSLNDLGRQAAALSARMAALGAAAAAVGAAFTAKLVKSGLEAIDSQAKLARSLDGTIDGLRALQLAAQDAGLSADAMSANLQRMNRRLGEMATTGAGPAAGWINRLGLSAQELLKLPLEERAARIADEISRLSTSAEMASAAFAIFGDGGLKMVPMLQQGGEAIRAARAEVDAFGLSLSEIDAAKIEMANDAMSRIGRVMEAIRNQITIAFAPFLKELADRFNAVARENRGFADAARSAAESAINGFAKLADAVHLVNIGFTGLKTVAMGFSAAFWSVLEGLSKGISALVNSVIDGVNYAITQLNKLPKVDLPQLEAFTGGALFAGIESAADTARGMLYDLREELSALVSQEWPSEKVQEFLDAVRARAEEAAQAVASVTTGGAGANLGGGSEGEEDPRAAELERYREMLATKLEALQEFLMTEAELELKRHEEKMEVLRAALEEELILQEEYDILKQELEEKHMEAMKKIREKGMTAMERFMAMSFANQAKTVAAGLAEMTAALARDSRTMFEINKVAGIANATVAMFQGIAEGLKLGWPRSIPAVAYAAAQGAAAIAGIKAQSFGGSGAAPSVAGTAPATPVTPVPNNAPQSGGGSNGSVLIVEGVGEDQLFSGRTIRAIAERLAEHIRDGGTVQFA